MATLPVPRFEGQLKGALYLYDIVAPVPPVVQLYFVINTLYVPVVTQVHAR